MQSKATALIEMACMSGTRMELMNENSKVPQGPQFEPQPLRLRLFTFPDTDTKNQVFFAHGVNQRSTKITTLVNNVFS